MPNIIVIGASAGGVGPLRKITGSLPADLQAALFIVLHLPPSAPSALPRILSTPHGLRTSAAIDGEPIEPSRIYVASPDIHLLVMPGYVRLSRAPRENRHRPAIDPLFRTAAEAYGSRVLGVVLTGLLDDGVVGLHLVKSNGGVAMVQDPGEAMFDSMPRKAIETVQVDYVLRTADMPRMIQELVREPWRAIEPERVVVTVPETRTAEETTLSRADEKDTGRTTMFTCPDCNGPLWEIHNGAVTRFKCLVGHVFSPASMRDAYKDAVEGALWTAVRTLEETATFERRLADDAAARGHDLSADRFNEVATSREQQAKIIRDLLMKKSETSIDVREEE